MLIIKGFELVKDVIGAKLIVITGGYLRVLIGEMLEWHVAMMMT